MSPSHPAVAVTRAELASARQRLEGEVAAVFTMGALHDGHRALLAAARRAAEQVLVTIFVNPLQFGPAEDYDRYPRTLQADLAVCAQAGASLVFAPRPADVYPAGEPQVRICAGELGRRWEGAVRPGHFDGVLTVVAKLCLLTRPQIAIFGEKDAQQLALLRRMVLDLDLPVRLVEVRTVRDPDGLATSSRNVYLSPPQRACARRLPEALQAALAQAPNGVAAARQAARQVLDAAPGLSVDYLAVVQVATFEEIDDGPAAGTRLIAAVRAGPTRLIDNVLLGTS